MQLKKIYSVIFILAVLQYSCVSTQEFENLNYKYSKLNQIFNDSLRQKQNYITEIQLTKNRQIAQLTDSNTVKNKLIDSLQKIVIFQNQHIKRLKQDSALTYKRDSVANPKLAQENTRLKIVVKQQSTEIKFLRDSLFRCMSGETLLKHTDHIIYNNVSFDYYIVDISYQNLKLFWKNGNGNMFKSFSSVKNYVEASKKQLVFAMNGGIFKENNTPQGLFVENGIEYTALDTTKNKFGNFYMQPNGVLWISNQGMASIVKTSDYEQLKKKSLDKNIRMAVQSGPMLLINGKINPNFTKGSANKLIRNGVGIINQHKIVFVISNQPVNFWDFTNLFIEKFHCNNALYLDGVISKMYAPELNRKELDSDFGTIFGLIK